MKVLYLLANYPKPSETYVAAEIDFMLRHGIEIQVFSPAGGRPGATAAVPVHKGRIKDALARFRPDLIHVHYLVVHHEAIDQAERAGIPVTVRGHSFDFSEANVVRMARHRGVRWIYLFPHFARRFPREPKVVALPVAFDPRAFYPEEKDRLLVLRAGAAKPNKGLGDFMSAAVRCPGHRFLLLADPVEPEWMPVLREDARGKVELREAVPNEEAALLTRKAAIYLETSDPAGHEFGMPVSVAEAMASGSLVLVRDGEGPRAYIGEGGKTYATVEEAASLIRGTLSWDEVAWASVRDKAVARSQAFHVDQVLPAMLGDWRRLTGK